MNILIIGATSGIGRELWKIYTSQGHHTCVMGRRRYVLEQMRTERPNETSVYEADITRTEETVQCLARIFADVRTVDLAIVCAGTGDLNTELSFEKEWPTLRTNVVGWTSVVDDIYKRFDRQGFGHLATVTSVGGLCGEPAAPAYSASKAYQINYTQALRKKSRRTNVCITEIRPGLVDTAMAKGEGLFWVMPADKVARQIARALARKPSKVIVTKRWRLVSFLLKHFL